MIETALTNVDWQSVTTLAIVFAALAGLVRRVAGLVASKSVQGCTSGCSGCRAGVQNSPALVQLDVGRPGNGR